MSDLYLNEGCWITRDVEIDFNALHKLIEKKKLRPISTLNPDALPPKY